jgi:hypothetical protein
MLPRARGFRHGGITLRARAGLSRVEPAQRMTTTQSTIARLESGLELDIILFLR